LTTKQLKIPQRKHSEKALLSQDLPLEEEEPLLEVSSAMMTSKKDLMISMTMVRKRRKNSSQELKEDKDSPVWHLRLEVKEMSKRREFQPRSPDLEVSLTLIVVVTLMKKILESNKPMTLV